MSRIFVILATVVLASCGMQKELQLVNAGAGIIGGTDVAEGAAIGSSIVAVFDKEFNSVCTASIIDENIIVTAAHCANNPQKLKVIFGNDMDLYLSAHEQDVLEMHVRQVTAVVRHPHYDPETPAGNTDQNDIAVMRFSGTLPPGYKPAALLTDDSVLKPGLMVTLAGFGVNDAHEEEVNPKKTKDFQKRFDDGEIYCEDEKHYRNCFEIVASGEGILRETKAPISLVGISEVVLDESKGHGTCMGDSGGPAYVQNGDQLFLFGVTSRGSALCDDKGVYTNIVFHLPWLQETLTSLKNR